MERLPIGPALREAVGLEFVRGGEGAVTRDEILIHVVNHDTCCHRGGSDRAPLQPS